MASCDDSPWERNTELGSADHPLCSTCNDGTHHRAGYASYATKNWWKQCNGLIWQVHWALTCNDCNCIISWLPQHHRWGRKTMMHRVTKKRSWQKTSATKARLKVPCSRSGRRMRGLPLQSSRRLKAASLIQEELKCLAHKDFRHPSLLASTS
jgi:hypothetical protein